jgi:hypothetical protein
MLQYHNLIKGIFIETYIKTDAQFYTLYMPTTYIVKTYND